MKEQTLGILAHVDAGKTTLSEAILYLSNSIRKLGRVDNQDAFLDTYALERERGITIFSKQAILELGDTKIHLLDTPGHVDFSAEMERTLMVLDYAILVISGADGVQGHTLTLWRLLKRYGIPTFLFVNKMDQQGTDASKLMRELKGRLDERCVCFTGLIKDKPSEAGGVDKDREIFYEELAMCSDSLLDEYMEEEYISKECIAEEIKNRHIFPVYFGSALKLEGVKELLEGVEAYTEPGNYGTDFGARVYKISRDDQGNRLTHMKITGGRIQVKMPVITGESSSEDGQSEAEEKIHQIRIYSGERFEAVSDAGAGSICAVTGLKHTKPGQGLGVEAGQTMPILEPVLTYRIEVPEDKNANQVFLQLKQLEEEEPELHLLWDETFGEIQARLMGEVQIEVLQSLIRERFGMDVTFGAGSILYRETIGNVVEGVGHYEPLRHYAEVHLKLEPLELGSGLQFGADCSEDVLARNWQRLILTHLEEKEHKGVLTGSAITDMKITLVGGRAHLKHTEGGDFRQSTYRAVRQGLRQAESVLLEPYYEFRLEVPMEQVGRALSDIDKMKGSASAPEIEGEMSVLTGKAPVATMRDYQREVIAYTRGQGRLFCTNGGYQPCHNAEEVICATQYDPEADLENPTGSVFCAHGAGFVVAWNEVQDYMHVENQVQDYMHIEKPVKINTWERASRELDSEDMAIFAPRYNAVEYERNRKMRHSTGNHKVTIEAPKPEYMLVDGYNVIYAWEELKELAEMNIDGARDALIDILCNYQGYRGCEMIVVFDAYRRKDNPGNSYEHQNITVVFTKEAETADQYIEKFAHKNGRDYRVTVVTSDGLEQVIIRGQGCNLISSREFKEEVLRLNAETLAELYENEVRKGPKLNKLDAKIPEEILKELS